MSDVVLYPIRGQLAQIKDKSEYIVYVPRATKNTYGTVKIGEGLISEEGVISVDLSNVKIDAISLNGSNIEPVDKRVNIVVSAATVGLDKVNNTADKDKPVSTATEEAIALAKSQVLDDVMNVEEALDDYKLEVENRFASEREEIDDDILMVSNTVSSNKNATDAEIVRLEELIKGKEEALTYSSYAELVGVFNTADNKAFVKGQSVYIQATNVPDLWVYSVESSKVTYSYTNDDAIINALIETGTVQIGYYKLAMMETKTTSVANAVTTDTVQTITAEKTHSLGNTYTVISNDYVTLQNKKSGASRTNVVYVSNGKTQVGSLDNRGQTFKGLEHDAETYTTNFTGVLTYGGHPVATVDSFKDSDSIVVSKDVLNNVTLELDAELTSRLAKTLVTPMSRPASTELVAIDNTNSQKMIEIGDGLSLENGILKAIGGGSGGEGGSGVVLLKEDFSTIDGLYNKLAELYNSNKDFVVSMTPTSSLSGNFYTMRITSTTHAPTDAGNTGTIMSANNTYRFRLVEKGSDYFMLAGVNNVNLTLKVYSWDSINATLKGLNSASASDFIFNVMSSSVSTTTFAKLGTSVYYYETESSEAIQQILNTEV